MCGIVGYEPIEPTADVFDAFGRLFDESRIRGQHAYGITTSLPNGLFTHRSFDWKEIPAAFCQNRSTIAHTRYCQSGDWRVMENNQPILAAEMALGFNGCIHMGTKEEFEAAFSVQCQSDNDGEVFLRLIADAADPNDLRARAEQVLDMFTGSFAGVWLAYGKLFAGRNARRPLWKCDAYGARWYASTGDIFRRAGFPLATEMRVGVEIA